MEVVESTIFSASQATEGKSYHVPYAIDIQGAIDAILDQQLKIKRNTAAIVDIDKEEMEQLSIKIPSLYTDKVRILLTSGAEIKNLKTDFNAETAKQFNGERYSLIEIKKPASSTINLSFQGKMGNQVKVDVITQYRLIPKIEVNYIDKKPVDINAAYYEREAAMKISFYDISNQNMQLLTDEIFNHVQIPIKMNEEIYTLSLSNGNLILNYPVTENTNLKIEFDYSSLPTNILSGNFAEQNLEEPPLLPPPPLPEPNYTPIYIAVGIALAVFSGVICFIIWKIRHRPITLPESEDTPPPPSKFSYTGKINIYITKTTSDYDIPPRHPQMKQK